jgi:superfamily I DNA/RNA helicase
VNLNEEEREVVERRTSALILGRSGTGKTTVMLQRLITDEILSGGAVNRAVFLTASPVLCEAIKAHYKSLVGTYIPQKQNMSAIAVDVLETLTFRTIPDDAFPLIITYDTLLRILENSLKVNSDGYREDQLIDFKHFEEVYYKHFPANIQRTFDAALIFTEIRSVLKGSMEAMMSSGTITKEEYEQLSARRNSDLSVEMRSLVYKAFQSYQQMKAERREYDMEDAVYRILQGLGFSQGLGLRTQEIKKFKGSFDSVFVDEIQDLSPAQVMVLSHVCYNLDKFFFAGDTAQTVIIHLFIFISKF